jgi:CBS domain-containing protein
LQIASLITRAVLTLEESESLREAAVLMMERGVGSGVVVSSDGKPTGIITDRDSLRAIALGRDGDALTVKDCLTRKLVTATADMEVMDAARIMREKNFRHLVVVDEAGALVGVFSMRDLVVGLLQERAAMVAEPVAQA